MKKKFFIFLLILLLPHCGFSPLYNQSNKLDYAINITEINGDKLINNKIISEIKQISNSQSKNKFNLKVNTSYEKIIISVQYYYYDNRMANKCRCGRTME